MPRKAAEELDDPLDVDGNGQPDFCDTVGDLTAWAITDDVVLQGNAPWTQGAVPELWPSPMWGAMAQPTILAIVMQVDPAVLTVRLTSPAGHVDSMEPVGGAVALTVPTPDGADAAFPGEADFFDGYQLIAQHGDGSVQRADWDSITNGHPAWGAPGPCNEGMEGEIFAVEEPAPTTPALPQPGVEQPADPDAARAEIETNFDSLYGNPDDGIDRSGVIDDASGLDVARRHMDANGFGDEASRPPSPLTAWCSRRRRRRGSATR